MGTAPPKTLEAVFCFLRSSVVSEKTGKHVFSSRSPTSQKLCFRLLRTWGFASEQLSPNCPQIVDTTVGRIQGKVMSTAPRCKRRFFEPFFSALQGCVRLMSKTFHRVTRQTFPMRCQLCCLPILARAPVLVIFLRLFWRSIFSNFGARGGDKFIRQCSRRAPITFDAL